jgi:hypothetical protein
MSPATLAGWSRGISLAVRHLGPFFVRQQPGEAPAVLGRHDPVLAGPDGERRLVVARQGPATRTRESGSAVAARSTRTASRRISGRVSPGRSPRAIAGSPRRVSRPNATGSRRTAPHIG